MSATMRHPETGPVLVGVDGSISSLTAVDLAAREATLRCRPLHIVHAFIWPLMHVPLGPSPVGPLDGGPRNEARRILGEAVTRARTTAPDLAVTGELITGTPVPVLLRCARDAALTVIGDRGLLPACSSARSAKPSCTTPPAPSRSSPTTAAHQPMANPGET